MNAHFDFFFFFLIYILCLHRQTEWSGDPVAHIQNEREEETAEAAADDTDQWS